MAKNFTYPIAQTGDVVEDYHGTPVSDPYRWMEDSDSADVRAFIAAQNKLTEAFLEEIKSRETIKARLVELWNFPRYFPPVHKGSRYFYLFSDGLKNQPVVYMQDSLHGKPVLVLDPNTFSEDGTVALTGMQISEDGTLIAYGTSSGGTDWQEIRIRDVATGRDYDEVIQWCRFASIAWERDSYGFYYNRGPAPDSGENPYYFNRVYWHQLGTPQSSDKLVYERRDAPELNFPPQMTDDGQYLVLFVWHDAGGKNRLYYRSVNSEADFVRLIDQPDAHYEFVGNTGTTFYVKTDLDAPRGRIVAIDIETPERENWREIIPQQDDVIDLVKKVDKGFVVVYLHDAHHRLMVYDPAGKFLHEVPLPTIGSIAYDISASSYHNEVFINFQSFLYPQAVFRYDFDTGELMTFRESGLSLQPDQYETKQVFYISKDGTRVPMFITHKKGLQLDGQNPTLLYAYGGYKISVTPVFDVANFVWIENGGVYAVANLRGGGEYGESWHQAGMLENKQNVFDDFISAGEWLIKNGYTSPEKLAIRGASNGGLLVAACMTQRPDLFGVVICGVPVADMLRYHRFTAGRYWIHEYGNAEENPEHFKLAHG